MNSEAYAGSHDTLPERSQCTCKTPREKHHEDGVYICATCGKRLMVDEQGKPYRRIPGDLDTPEHRMALAVLDQAAKVNAEMLEMIQHLPVEQKRRLLALSKKNPRKFRRTAKHMIAVHLQKEKAEQTGALNDKLSPNAQRRLRREMADAIDALHPNSGLCGKIATSPEAEDLPHPEEPIVIEHSTDANSVDHAECKPQDCMLAQPGPSLTHTHTCASTDGERCISRGFCKCACGAVVGLQETVEGWADAHEKLAMVKCDLCGFMKHPTEHDGHGLGDCVEICSVCGGNGESKVYVDGEGPDRCENCNGSGAEPPLPAITEYADGIAARANPELDATTQSNARANTADDSAGPPAFIGVDLGAPEGDRGVKFETRAEPKAIIPPKRKDVLRGLGI